MNPAAEPSFTPRVLARFRRITSSGQFIAEIDGLRFIAIASVVLWHIKGYLQRANHYTYAAPCEYFKRFLGLFANAWRGVEIFFVISGFILALPFALRYMRGGRAVSLRQYFLRRVTRLEPPYMVAMVLCFLMIWHRRHEIAGYSAYVSSFLASLIYSHNFFWPRATQPLVNPVTWSLEIEVQFYILAPLIACVYRLGRTPRRWLLVLPVLGKLCVPPDYQPAHVTLLDFFDYFLVGFILADLYVNRELEIAKREWLATTGAAVSFAAILFCPVQCLALVIGLFFFCCFKSAAARRLLGNRWITTIGGMCYSIYLVHWMLITTLGGRMMRQFTGSYAVDFVVQAALLAVLVLIAGAIYFKLIERPCMARDWPERLFAHVKGVLSFRKTIPVNPARANEAKSPAVDMDN